MGNLAHRHQGYERADASGDACRGLERLGRPCLRSCQAAGQEMLGQVGEPSLPRHAGQQRAGHHHVCHTHQPASASGSVHSPWFPGAWDVTWGDRRRGGPFGTGMPSLAPSREGCPGLFVLHTLFTSTLQDWGAISSASPASSIRVCVSERGVSAVGVSCAMSVQCRVCGVLRCVLRCVVCADGVCGVC